MKLFRLTLVAVAVTGGACGPADLSAPITSSISGVCVSSPTLNPLTSAIHTGDTVRLTAGGMCAPAPGPRFTWTSFDTAVVSVAAVDDTTAVATGRRPGMATVGASLVSEPAAKVAAVINVIP